jgi:tRNA U34 2-thiouridine synthase MnmA/TrmU
MHSSCCGYLKTDVRVIAQNFNLPVAERPDSQDLCFIGSSEITANF